MSSGLFFLDLLWAVEPRVVNWNLVTKGESGPLLSRTRLTSSQSKPLFSDSFFLAMETFTDDEKRLNATYIVSVARKLGCSVFLLPEDIVEVKNRI